MPPVGNPRHGQVWRITFRFVDGRTDYVDAYGFSPQWGWEATDAARAEMRRRHGDGRWWIESWLLLMPLVGHPARLGETHRRIEGPSLRRRARVAWRQLRRHCRL